MAKKSKATSESATSDNNNGSLNKTKATVKSKRDRSEGTEAPRKMPKRAAACSDFKEKALSRSEKSLFVKTKRKVLVEYESEAIALTCGQEESRPRRRLSNFFFHGASGNPLQVEMLEVGDLFISGIVLPLEESPDKKKGEGIRCEDFGRIETWSISGYEEGVLEIWISTQTADYNCVKPANGYKKIYSLFLEKARACVETYRKLSRTSGGNPELSLDELLAAVVRSMSSSKNFPHGSSSIKDFLFAHGEFIYNQLIGLDETSQKNDQIFTDLPVLSALLEESKKHRSFTHLKGTASGGVVQNTSLRIGDAGLINQSISSATGDTLYKDVKMSMLLQEEEDWMAMNKSSCRRPVSSSKSKYYIKINEDEIASDYPLPAYYTTTNQETDEYIIIDNAVTLYPDELPRNLLHNWALYNSDSRLISLELLPMKPCADIDVSIFGSGIITADDGTGYFLDSVQNQSSSSLAGAHEIDGIPIYLSAIKEWMIEFGSSMVFISIQTDMGWYRLGKPSKQYAPWYEPVLKTARLAIGIITLLKEQSRVSRFSFKDVVRKVADFNNDHQAYISSNPAEVERYVVVHGQIILQQFAEFPDDNIRKCPFVTGLQDKMEKIHHTKWLVKKNLVLKNEQNLNPRAAVAPVVSKRKAMAATTTSMVNRIWGEYYSNYLPEDSKGADVTEMEEDENEEISEEEDVEDQEDEKERKRLNIEFKTPRLATKITKLCSNKDIIWDDESVGKTCKGDNLYKRAIVCGDLVAVGGFVIVKTENPNELSSICFVEYMFETPGQKKMVHGRLMMRGVQTVLGNTVNEREVFLTNDCFEFELEDVKQAISCEIRLMHWGHQHRKANAHKAKNDRERAQERKMKGLPMEYYCKSLYWPERGAFFCLPTENMGLGTGLCHSCKTKETQMEKDAFTVSSSGTSFTHRGSDYHVNDFLYVAPLHFPSDDRGHKIFKGGKNVGLRAYAVCQVLEIRIPKASKLTSPESTSVKVRRFFRPEDISTDKAYCSDIREVYYSEETSVVPVVEIEGKCEVRKKHDLPCVDTPVTLDHIFFCEHFYDPVNGTITELPAHIKFSCSKSVIHDAAHRKKGKSKEDEHEVEKQTDAQKTNRLATLDIFAGCGGLSEGLQLAGVSQTKWAIEYEEPAGKAFNLNHPEALTFINNCNVILSAIMSACGDADDIVSTSEAADLATKLDEKLISNLPRPGEVEFINGGPPCQGFSGMNRFNQSTWSKVQCEMILAFLSFAEYFRPKYFLLENVRNFISFNKGQTFRLTLASLLEMGYQVRFGILEAGAYGVSQSRKRAFIWAASPEETLPEWPEPMHVFAGPKLKVTLSEKTQYAAVRSTSSGAPFRAITVRDTIGDLPAVANGASLTVMEYQSEPVSWFQRKIRGDMLVLNDHISKEMNELNLTRCQKIPKRPGADWRNLPDEKVHLSSGKVEDLIPWCLPNTAERNNEWKGLYGRLDWKGNFPTSITDPQPMGKVGMCFHPDQDRILTVREYARSQGFPDSYKFAGNKQHKHRQVGNAVPPPLAFALGVKLKEAVETSGSTS